MQTPKHNKLYVYAVATIGGLFGVIGAVLEEFSQGFGVLAFLIGPAIEEIVKPAGIIYLLEKKPNLFSSRAQVIILALIGALVFATTENLVYIFLYVPQHSQFFVFFRFFVCTSLHLSCTSILALGLSSRLEDIKSAKIKFELEDYLSFIVVAIAVHALYNIVASFIATSDYWLIRK